MKKLVLLFALSTLLSTTFPYERLSIVERFTNASCAPCAQINNSWYNATTQNLVSTDQIAHIIYNGWWPGAGDPMYLLNQTDNTARINYYGVNAVPWIEVNGVTIAASQSALINAVNNGNSLYSPFLIEIVQEAVSTDLIQIRIIITRDQADTTTLGSNIKLRVGLTEKTVAFSSPPGSNGESTFFSVCRKMLPNAQGTSFTIPNPGESTEVTLQYIPTAQFLQAVNLDSIRVVAFIQNDQNQMIYQAKMTEIIPDFVVQVIQTSPDVIGLINESAEFSARIYNVGFMNDVYDVTTSVDGPSGWSGQFTTVNGIFNFGDQDELSVAVSDSTDISITLHPNGFAGAGKISLHYTSQNNPEVTGVLELHYVTVTGVPGLIIDATNEDYGNLLINVMDQEFGYTYGIVTRDALYPSVDLTNFNLICWSTGNAFPVFTQNEVNALMPFLDNGGRLLINGQNIGKDIFDPSGQSQFAQSFYNDYLHASYVSDWGLSYFFNGLAGDPISDGMTFPLADIYSRSPDEFIPNDVSATSLFKFGTLTKYNSIKADDGNTRVVYFGFGMEQISDQATRDTLISRAINWLMTGVVIGVEDEQPVVNIYSLDQNYPNPFNPSTKISYRLADDVNVNLKIYDLMGQEVAQLVNEKQAPGVYEVTFDARNLASGMYFYKLTAGNFVSVKKMTLLK